ncbi:MAG TPA: ABC transporter ATP-binding protein [Thermoleophilaceae bacterium]|jgi:multiple sugar transport system ATP-binding protein|nr:ABC transporter ATP-binding protein [Thermoleophilaceae bacterium]
MPGIRLEALIKSYKKHGPRAVDHVDLEVRDGEFMVLVGPSGCGKSTMMRMIAGIEEVTAGRILIGDRDVTHLDARKRDVAMVFQNYALYPHLSVRQNLGFGLKLRGTGKPQIAARVAEVAQVLGLDAVLDRRPGELSGGQRQRVAMGRAIVREPAAFLMDEPLSNLDAKLRVSMRAELSRLHERLGITTVYVTHDQVEAMTLGDRVAVLRDGVLQQCASPDELFRAPANLFVAGFIGSPAMNFARGSVTADGHVEFAGWRVPAGAGSAPAAHAGREVIVGIRPHDLALAVPGADADLPRVRATVEVVERLGTETHVIFPVQASRTGDEGVLLAADSRALFTAVVDPRATVAAGETVELVLDPGRLHVFDPDTELTLGPAGAPNPQRAVRPASRAGAALPAT